MVSVKAHFPFIWFQQIQKRAKDFSFLRINLLPVCTGSTFGVRLLVQVENGTHLADLAASITDDAVAVVDHEVGEVLIEGFALRQHEAQAQLKQAFRLQVAQSKSLGHDVFQPPVGPLFLVGFRQIQIVLPDILQRGRKEPHRRRDKERKQSQFESQNQVLCFDWHRD